jgi:hypothetical protein
VPNIGDVTTRKTVALIAAFRPVEAITRFERHLYCMRSFSCCFPFTLPITANHCQSLPITANHCQSLPAVVNHCQVQRIITIHCRNLTMCRESNSRHSWIKAEPTSSVHTPLPMVRPRGRVLSGRNSGLGLSTASIREAETVPEWSNNNHHRIIKVNASSLCPI